jgi:hypothetical protein
MGHEYDNSKSRKTHDKMAGVIKDGQRNSKKGE